MSGATALAAAAMGRVLVHANEELVNFLEFLVFLKLRSRK